MEGVLLQNLQDEKDDSCRGSACLGQLHQADY
jgi:hypothetical protein